MFESRVLLLLTLVVSKWPKLTYSTNMFWELRYIRNCKQRAKSTYNEEGQVAVHKEQPPSSRPRSPPHELEFVGEGKEVVVVVDDYQIP